jgi:RNA polymerase sigma factor (sigma-70 family)
MTPESVNTEGAEIKRSLVEALYRQYSKALSTFLARQRLQPDEVADIVQETYCRVQRAGNVEGIRDPRAFLFRVASNIRFNERKLRRSSLDKERVDLESVEIPSDAPSAYRSFKGEQDLKIVCAAFDELSDRCREAFVMNRFENRTYPQIAARLGISVSMVENTLRTRSRI